MSIAIGLVALSLVVAEPASQPNRDWIKYTVHTVDTPALEWRESFYTQTKTLGRQGPSQIWTTSKATANVLLSQKNDDVRTMPAVSGAQDSSVGMNVHTARLFATGVDLVVSPSTVEYRPQTATIRDGFSASFNGRVSTEGIKTKIVLDSNWLAEVREIRLPSNPTVPLGYPGEKLVVQVPEVVAARVKGEWTIPDGDVLIISLGTHAVGKKELRLVERLAIIEAHKMASPISSVVPVAYFPDLVDEVGNHPAIAARPMPPLPDRSLLPAIDLEGHHVALPPLPDEALAPASLSETSEPRPTPQTRVAATALKQDGSIVQTRFESPAKLEIDGAKLASGRAQSLRLPISERLSIAIEIKVVPTKP